MAKSLPCWSCGACLALVNHGGGTDGQDTGKSTNATAIPGHLEHLLGDCRHAAMMTVFTQKCLIGTARMLTAVPLFPLGSGSMLNHVGVLTSRTSNLEEGHGDLRDSA